MSPAALPSLLLSLPPTHTDVHSVSLMGPCHTTTLRGAAGR